MKGGWFDLRKKKKIVFFFFFWQFHSDFQLATNSSKDRNERKEEKKIISFINFTKKKKFLFLKTTLNSSKFDQNQWKTIRILINFLFRLFVRTEKSQRNGMKSLKKKYPSKE